MKSQSQPVNANQRNPRQRNPRNPRNPRKLSGNPVKSPKGDKNNCEIDSVPIRYFRHISTENVNDNGNRVVFDSLSIRMHHYLLDLSSCTINYQDYDF